VHVLLYLVLTHVSMHPTLVGVMYCAGMLFWISRLLLVDLFGFSKIADPAGFYCLFIPRSLRPFGEPCVENLMRRLL
jgi:hypothetical protein